MHKAAANDPEHPSPIKIFVKAALVGAGLLSAVYVCLVLLGSTFSTELIGVPPQEMFGVITMKALGPYAAPGVCMALVLACITTAIVLASLFSDFLRKEVLKDKISHNIAMCTTLIIGFLVSTLEFSGIACFLGPILETVYPALILLTLANIALKMRKAVENQNVQG